jgi:hypothetical protein
MRALQLKLSALDFVASAKTIYEKIFRADNRLAAINPLVGRDFPTEIRDQAFWFPDRRLN